MEDEIETAFNQHIAEFGKMYGTKEEYQFRLNIFSQNMKKIAEHNSENTEFDSHRLEINHMADWTEDEYKTLLGYKADLKKKNSKVFERTEADLPESVDWRKEGAVTPIKNQGMCGSCWSFSATGAMEGAYQQKNGKLVAFSEQQFVECDTQSAGCGGGLMDYAFEYAEKNMMETEEQYPYTGLRGGKCKAEGGFVEIQNFTDVAENDPTALAEALAKGPVSVAIDASGVSM